MDQNNLERALRDELADAVSEQEQHYNALGELKDFAGMLGQRLGKCTRYWPRLPTTGLRAANYNAKQAQAIGKDVVSQVENALRLLKQNQRAS